MSPPMASVLETDPVTLSIIGMVVGGVLLVLGVLGLWLTRKGRGQR